MTTEYVAKQLGWGYLYPDHCPECPGEDGQHAMSCSRGGGGGRLTVPVAEVCETCGATPGELERHCGARLCPGDECLHNHHDGCPHCDAPGDEP